MQQPPSSSVQNSQSTPFGGNSIDGPFSSHFAIPSSAVTGSSGSENFVNNPGPSMLAPPDQQFGVQQQHHPYGQSVNEMNQQQMLFPSNQLNPWVPSFNLQMENVPPSSQQPNPGNQQGISGGDDPNNHPFRQQEQNQFGLVLPPQVGQQQQFEELENEYPDMNWDGAESLVVEGGESTLNNGGAGVGSEWNENNEDLLSDEWLDSLAPLSEILDDIGVVVSEIDNMYTEPPMVAPSQPPNINNNISQPLKSIHVEQACKQSSNSEEAVAGSGIGASLQSFSASLLSDEWLASLAPSAEVLDDNGGVVSEIDDTRIESPMVAPSQTPNIYNRREPLTSIDLEQAWKQSSNRGEASAGSGITVAFQSFSASPLDCIEQPIPSSIGGNPPHQQNQPHRIGGLDQDSGSGYTSQQPYLESHGKSNGSGADMILGPRIFDEITQHNNSTLTKVAGNTQPNELNSHGKSLGKSRKNEQPYKCNVCEKSFKYRSHLARHEKGHSGVKEFKCDYCNRFFMEKHGLQRHLSTHTVLGTPFKCEICSSGYKTKVELTQHKRIIHDPKVRFRYKCTLCEKGYPTKSTLYLHARSHTNECPYICKVCKREFRHKIQLISHLETHDDPERTKDFQCPLCPTAFYNQRILKQHIQTHEKKRFKCTSCQKDFRTKETLRQHKKKYHSKLNLYFCGVCLSSFPLQTDVNSHMRIHETDVF